MFTCSCADQVKSDSLFSKEVDETELDLAFKSETNQNAVFLRRVLKLNACKNAHGVRKDATQLPKASV